jgi:hypothetical protein
MSESAERTVVFVCQHGAFRSRIAAAFFNAAGPQGWSAVSAGLTPQSEASVRLGPLMAGYEPEPFVDTAQPRSLDSVAATRTIAIDADVPGAEIWRTDGDQTSDAQLRDEIELRVQDLVATLSRTGGDARL